MEFIYGTGLLVAAVVLLAIAKYAIGRFETASWVRRFAATETMALVMTATVAFGIAFLCTGVATAESSAVLTELGASLGVVALAIVATVRLFRRKPQSVKTAGAAVTTDPATI